MVYVFQLLYKQTSLCYLMRVQATQHIYLWRTGYTIHVNLFLFDLFRSICSGFGILKVFALKCNVAFCALLHDVETIQNLKTLYER